ncbi:MAG: lipocalin-like domain-containing protein, partial [Pseudomonadota bacterium]
MIRVAIVFLGLLLPAQSLAQGFAGMGSEAGDGYAEVRPETPIAFPADHGPHPDFRIEWWYVTANLEDAEGTPYGLQWTLFRSAL